MTANRELNGARPASAHRPSISSSSSAGTMASSRPSQSSRPHAHSLSVGSINPQHRVSRRKSMSNTTTVANSAAVAALVKGEPVGTAGKRTSAAKTGAATRAPSTGGFPSSLPSHSPLLNGPSNSTTIRDGSAVVDGPPLASLAAALKSSKSKMRRASEGSRLGKGEGRRVPSGAELRCETCGKGYKHSSCLTKHLWEHTPEWAITSKLLISKHQQVQLLEAASVLVTMNQDAVAESDHSSPSPAASGSSDPRDDESIATSYTPPPQNDDPAVGSFASRTGFGHARLESTGSSAYSQSYNSVFSDHGSSGRPYVSHYRQWSSDNRPSTSGTSYDDEDQADLAAAVGLLSCSYGTPKTGPVMVLPDVPPVPPLPAKFLGQRTDTLSGSTIQPTPQQRGNWGHRHADSQDVDMYEDSDADADQNTTARGRSEEDEGVFGKMEE